MAKSPINLQSTVRSLAKRGISTGPSVRLDTRSIKIVQEDGAVVGELPIKDGAETRLLEVDVGGKFARISSVEKLLSNVIPINERSYRETRLRITTEIMSSVEQDFPELGDVKDRRLLHAEKLAERLLDILNIDPNRPTSWVSVVGAQDKAETPRRNLRNTPDLAPAYWREAKMVGDTPPDFIKRHYSAWLQYDGLGMARSDLRRLDKPLYAALASWLHEGNELPADCPLPTKSEAVKAEMAILPNDMSQVSARDMARKRAWARYQER